MSRGCVGKEPLDVHADLDDVLAEELDDEGRGPFDVMAQRQVEGLLTCVAVVVPGVDAPGGNPARRCERRNRVGREVVVDPARDLQRLAVEGDGGPLSVVALVDQAHR